MDIKSISNDCIFEADFKYVYKITGQRSREIKKNVKLWSKLGQNGQRPKKNCFSIKGLQWPKCGRLFVLARKNPLK